MPVAIDTVAKLHAKQIEAANRSQDLAVSAVEKVSAVVRGLRAKSPAVPDVVAGPLEKVAAPLTAVIGTPSDVTAFATRSVRDWAQAQQRFQGSVVAALVSEDAAAPAKASAKRA